MHFLSLTLDEPAENLALDDALQEAVETGEIVGGVLRIWESPRPLVILGRSSRLEQEVRGDACQRDGISVLRRSSGGATIVAGPGCLMYAVVVGAEYDPRLPAIDAAHEFVLGRIAAALAPLAPGVVRAGISDLALGGWGRPERVPSSSPRVMEITAGGATLRPQPPAINPAAPPLRKFSGNSLRVRRRSVLYHGTLMYDFDLACLERWLAEPPRQPEYRERRGHGEFVANLPLSRQAIVDALAAAWDAREPLADWPRAQMQTLRTERQYEVTLAADA